MIKIILCALNEVQNLKILLPEINAQMKRINLPYQILICLDGSSDDSKEYILTQKNSYPIEILPQINEKGLGKAMKRLFLKAASTSNDNELIISMDADNTHFPSQIEDLITKNKGDVVILSRFCKESKMLGFPFYRILISKTTSFVMRLFFGIRDIENKKIKDYSSGYRCYRVKSIKKLIEEFGDNFITNQDFTYTCELLINLDKIGAKFQELPLHYDYSKKIGESKLRFFSNAKSLLRLIYQRITK
jgi:dolichol-phosphate mannosyltransferase